MAVVTVSLTIGTTCYYWLTPQASVDTVGGTGLIVGDIISGSVSEPADLTPVVQDFLMDNSFAWDLRLDFRNASPIEFYGFLPGSGGDMLELLTAQGWTPL